MTDSDKPGRIEHRMERRYEVAATPEQVWGGDATADGISAWMAPTRLDPQVGGDVSFGLGGFVSTGVVTGCTPNERFAVGEPWPIADHMPTAHHDLSSLFHTPIATEFLIEVASGGSCVIPSVVTSEYGAGADWENEFFAEWPTAWGAMLDNLVTHLERGEVARLERMTSFIVIDRQRLQRRTNRHDRNTLVGSSHPCRNGRRQPARRNAWESSSTQPTTGSTFHRRKGTRFFDWSLPEQESTSSTTT